MEMLKLDGVTHWSIPVNDLEESEKFYQEVLGLEYKGRLGNSAMSCFRVGGLSQDKILKSMGRFARFVMPALR